MAVGANCPRNPAYDSEPAIPRSLHGLSQPGVITALLWSNYRRGPETACLELQVGGIPGGRWCNCKLGLGLSGGVLAFLLAVP